MNIEDVPEPFDEVSEQEYQEQIAIYEKEIREYERKELEYKEKIKEYKAQVKTLIDKSSDFFEKQLIYVAAGTLAASVFIVDKFLSGIQNAFFLVMLCWVMCGATIIINLLSHYYAMKYYGKTYDEINSDLFDKEKADRRARYIDKFNGVSLIIYFFGMGSLITYTIININNMNKPKEPVNNTSRSKSVKYPILQNLYYQCYQ